MYPWDYDGPWELKVEWMSECIMHTRILYIYVYYTYTHEMAPSYTTDTPLLTETIIDLRWHCAVWNYGKI